MRFKTKIATAIVALMVLGSLAPVIGPAMAQGENDVWYIAMQQDMPNFNNWDLASNSVWKNYVLGKWCWEGLSGLDPDGNIFPNLAEDWTFDLDTLTTTITLRQGVTFHDGETMDADDVLFSFKALRNGGTFSSNIVNAFDTDGDGTVSLDEFDGTISSQDDGIYDGWTKVEEYLVCADCEQRLDPAGGSKHRGEVHCLFKG